MDLVDSLDSTFRHAHTVIGGVRADQYDDPTPCAEWCVRDLLSHMIGVVGGVGVTVGAAPAPEGSEFELGPNPAAQFEVAAAATLEAWRAPGVMDLVIEVGPGPMPASMLARINLLDTATHTWDLATATGQPAGLPESVVTAALEIVFDTIVSELRPGRFDPALEAPPGASDTERLLAFLGRKP